MLTITHGFLCRSVFCSSKQYFCYIRNISAAILQQKLPSIWTNCQAAHVMIISSDVTRIIIANDRTFFSTPQPPSTDNLL